MAWPQPEIKDGCRVRRNQFFSCFLFVLLSLLILWIEFYAVPLAVIWLIVRWRKDTWPERIFYIAGLAVIFAVAHVSDESAHEKMDRSIVVFIVALLAPVVSRLTRKREE